MSLGQVAQLGGASARYAKAVGSIPGQGTYKKSTNECINELNNKSMFVFLYLSSFPPPLKK